MALIATTALASSGCGSRLPASPSASTSTKTSVPTMVTGSWAGAYTLNCPTRPDCAVLSSQVAGSSQPVALVLQQNGGGLSGQINLAGWLGRAASVTGTVGSDGTMSLQGGDSWTGRDGDACDPAGAWNLTAWNTIYDPHADTIQGSFGFVTQKGISSCFILPDLAVQATVVTLRRQAMPPTTFDGHWQGSFVLTDCAPLNVQGCATTSLNDALGFNLTLTQTGSAVAGMMNVGVGSFLANVPVTGTVSADGAGITLQGEISRPMSCGVETLRLTSWSATRDSIGRLTGQFSYTDSFASSCPDLSIPTTTWNAELKYVVYGN